MPSLFEPYDLAGLKLANRVVMAPMTRARAPHERATPMIAEYYKQRSTAGLIVTEGTFISPESRGFLFVPGLFRQDQLDAWRLVTEAVHEEGGRVFAQLWHVGRVSHSSLQKQGRAPVSSTSEAGGAAFAYGPDGTPGIIPSTPPRALSTEEVPRIAEEFARAAAAAIAAGFDGVEIHAANGYLFEQFLNPKVNLRSDIYGGGIGGRARPLLETVQAISDRIGADRVGVRVSPFSFLFDMPDYDSTDADYVWLGAALSALKIAYLHLMDQGAVSRGFDAEGEPRIGSDFLERLRKAHGGTLILTGGMTAERGQQLIDAGLVDLVGFGRPFISNPDLVRRMRRGLPLSEPRPQYFYGGGPEGYVDYPAFEEAGLEAGLLAGGV